VAADAVGGHDERLCQGIVGDRVGALDARLVEEMLE
jgi:hypothetical protein